MLTSYQRKSRSVKMNFSQANSHNTHVQIKSRSGISSLQSKEIERKLKLGEKILYNIFRTPVKYTLPVILGNWD